MAHVSSVIFAHIGWSVPQFPACCLTRWWVSPHSFQTAQHLLPANKNKIMLDPMYTMVAMDQLCLCKWAEWIIDTFCIVFVCLFVFTFTHSDLHSSTGRFVSFYLAAIILKQSLFFVLFVLCFSFLQPHHPRWLHIHSVPHRSLIPTCLHPATSKVNTTLSAEGPLGETWDIDTSRLLPKKNFHCCQVATVVFSNACSDLT